MVNPDTNVAKGLTVAGEVERRPAQHELDAEGTRLGQNFGLGGPCQGAVLARRHSAQ